VGNESYDASGASMLVSKYYYAVNTDDDRETDFICQLMRRSRKAKQYSRQADKYPRVNSVAEARIVIYCAEGYLLTIYSIEGKPRI
jgi:hypothetical protein